MLGCDDKCNKTLCNEVHCYSQWEVSRASDLCKGRRYSDCQSYQQCSVQCDNSLVRPHYYLFKINIKI